MHVFHIRGLSSVLLLLLAIVGAVLLLLALPATFMMVLWNALVFEAIKGPEINLYQGFLLWGMVLVALKLTLKPEIQLEFIKASDKERKAEILPPEILETDTTLSDQNDAATLENSKKK